MTASVRTSLQEALCTISGIVESDSMFKDDLAYWVNGKEIAHFESDRVIEIRLTRSVISENRARLRADQRVDLRRSGSDWIEVVFTKSRDRDFVLELAELAAAAHRAPPGATPSPPPTGGDLERRRRFH
ncbi:MAG: luciferase family protein [Acidimicrobiia bacterium]